jgi:hypothetical protein
MLYDSAGKLAEKKQTLICHCITATLCTGAMIQWSQLLVCPETVYRYSIVNEIEVGESNLKC